MPENTGFLGGVAANWLQKSVINLLSELYEYVYFECRREICGILCIDFSKRRLVKIRFAVEFILRCLLRQGEKYLV